MHPILIELLTFIVMSLSKKLINQILENSIKSVADTIKQIREKGEGWDDTKQEEKTVGNKALLSVLSIGITKDPLEIYLAVLNFIAAKLHKPASRKTFILKGFFHTSDCISIWGPALPVLKKFSISEENGLVSPTRRLVSTSSRHMSIFVFDQPFNQEQIREFNKILMRHNYKLNSIEDVLDVLPKLDRSRCMKFFSMEAYLLRLFPCDNSNFIKLDLDAKQAAAGIQAMINSIESAFSPEENHIKVILKGLVEAFKSE
ncbi:MAG: hypothetical protein JXA25_19600 [Anaerolineales bacterium]|nr:hypothetical protein [Anaerolineales bacterium]